MSTQITNFVNSLSERNGCDGDSDQTLIFAAASRQASRNLGWSVPNKSKNVSLKVQKPDPIYSWVRQGEFLPRIVEPQYSVDALP